MQPLKVSASSMVNSMGYGKKSTLDAIKEMSSGLISAENTDVKLDTYLGIVDALEDKSLPKELSHFECRNNRLAKQGIDADSFKEAVKKACEKYGPQRVGIFLGTSTSGIAATEEAYRHIDLENDQLPDSFDYMNTHNLQSLENFCRQYLGITGAGVTISTACSSSSKVFAAAERYIRAGLCDAAVVGGVDSLCLTTLYGFHSLQLVSPGPCQPWGESRSGISIGEAAGFALLEKANDAHGVFLKGYGESSDAYHMSTPHPEGAGAIFAMKGAIEMAELSPYDIGYVNLHGTGTITNDAAEDAAVVKTLGMHVPCSSTKGWTGHTLGAAGITEALISLLILENNLLPANLNMTTKDATLSVNILTETVNANVTNVLSNSFGFGGSNSCLVFGKY